MGQRPLPSLVSLQAFCAIAEASTFGQAAERIGLTQTAISHQIAQLEGWLGGKLFVRSRRGAELTPLGVSLYPAVLEAVSRLETSLHTARIVAVASEPAKKAS